MNVWAPPLGASRTAVMSSSGSSAVRFTPSRNSESGSVRTPRTLASSTSRPSTRSGGSASPAGDAVPRFPPIVPRFRICGEPTVRDASASAGSRLREGRAIASVYVSPRRAGARRPSSDHPRSSASSARLTIAGGREWAEVELDHHVGAALDEPCLGMLGLELERLLDGRGGEHVPIR